MKTFKDYVDDHEKSKGIVSVEFKQHPEYGGETFTVKKDKSTALNGIKTRMGPNHKEHFYSNIKIKE